MKEKKDKQVNVRLSEQHIETLNKLIQDDKAKTISGALVYLVNQYAILGK